MVWFLLHNSCRKSIHASLCMQSIMNANNFSSDHSDHIETYKHAVTHAHIITHLFFFLKTRAVPHCFSVAVLSFRRAEVLHTDSDTDFCPPGHPLRLQEGRAPRWQHFLRGTGWIFLQAWRSSPGRQLVPTLQNVWMDSQMPTLACSL